MTTIDEIDAIIALPNFAPYHGWHDDHREKDGTAEYRPALMQVRAEFAKLVEEIDRYLGPRGYGNAKRRNALQLGMGNCRASHAVWRHLFDCATTIDFGVCMTDGMTHPGMDTHSEQAFQLARSHGFYDVLFIDAGHTYDDVAKDYAAYVTLVRPGGIIAFHDSLPRERYPEVEVWRFLKESGLAPSQIGQEVGIAWLQKL
jgi:hypothetical protein